MMSLMWRGNKIKVNAIARFFAYAQPYITTHADLPSRARGLYFGKIPYLHPYLVYTSEKGLEVLPIWAGQTRLSLCPQQ